MAQIEWENVIEKLKSDGLPIFIWGNGMMSIEVEERLKEKGIYVKGKFVNLGYCSGQQVFSLGELEKRYKKFNVVVGQGHFEKIVDISDSLCIHCIYIIANPYQQYQGPGKQWLDHNKEKIERACLSVDAISKKCLWAYYHIQSDNNINHLLNQSFLIPDMFGLPELSLGDNEIYVDVGAYTGDSIDVFTKATYGKYQHIYAFEPDPQSFGILQRDTGTLENIDYFQIGLGKESKKMSLALENTKSAYLVESDLQEGVAHFSRQIDVKTLDEVMQNTKVSLIKISVPFLFLDILQGAEQCIRSNRPKLVVNVGAGDGTKIINTIEWIEKLELGYRISFRNDFPAPTRIFIYAY